MPSTTTAPETREGPKIPVLEREGVGWFFWELMIAKTQFNTVQGIVYPDGTVRDAPAVAALCGTSVDDIPFEVKPESEGVAYTKGEIPKESAPDPEATGQELIDPRDTRPLLCEFVAEAQRVLRTQLGPPPVPYRP